MQSSSVPTYVLFLHVTFTTSTPVSHTAAEAEQSEVHQQGASLPSQAAEKVGRCLLPIMTFSAGETAVSLLAFGIFMPVGKDKTMQERFENSVVTILLCKPVEGVINRAQTVSVHVGCTPRSFHKSYRTGFSLLNGNISIATLHTLRRPQGRNKL